MHVALCCKTYGAIKVLRNAVGGFPGKSVMNVQFNVIGVTRGWVGVKFLGKKRYVTLELPLLAF